MINGKSDNKALYTRAEAEALCEIAAAAVKKSVTDYCRSMIVPRYAGGGISIEAANAAYERVIGMLESR